MRYTAAVAREQLKTYNAKLAKLGHDCDLHISARNGYYGLDVYRVSNGSCIRTEWTGTPAKCIEAARNYLGDVALDIALECKRGN